MLHMLGLVESFTDYLQSTQEMENETKFETPKKGKTKSKIYNSPLQLSVAEFLSKNYDWVSSAVTYV